MEQPKKIFTRMCLSNWGGISHKVLEFNEYINLFSGMSGSGKSTVMDAIQILLYGSMSSNFLNKAADDSKNKRSVFSYLRGEQKDGSANRANRDFRTIVVLELKDKIKGFEVAQGITQTDIAIPADTSNIGVAISALVELGYSQSEAAQALSKLDSREYGFILRAKGIVAAEDGTWIHFDYVPGEINIRTGGAAVTGKLCVIGSELDEAAIAALFGV